MRFKNPIILPAMFKDRGQMALEDLGLASENDGDPGGFQVGNMAFFEVANVEPDDENKETHCFVRSGGATYWINLPIERVLNAIKQEV